MQMTGSACGADIAFIQPDLLLEDFGLLPRMRAEYGCPTVLLQGSEQSARTLQADDFVVRRDTAANNAWHGMAWHGVRGQAATLPSPSPTTTGCLAPTAHA